MSVTITVNDDGSVKGWLTVIEFAELKGLKPGTVRMAALRGNVSSIHVGPRTQGITLIPEDADIHTKKGGWIPCRCGNCGVAVSPKSNYCSFCGEKLKRGRMQ